MRKEEVIISCKMFSTRSDLIDSNDKLFKRAFPIEHIAIHYASSLINRVSFAGP